MPVSPDRSKLRLPLTQGRRENAPPHQSNPAQNPADRLPRADSNPPGKAPTPTPSRPAEAARGETLAMAASVDAAAAAVAVAPPTAVEEAGGAVEQARTLIGALNLLSRNLPLPPDVLRAVSSIYHDGSAEEEDEEDGEEREAEKEGDGKEMAAADGVAEAKEDPADGATTKVRAGGSSGSCVDFPTSVRVLPGMCVGLVSRCWGPACYGLWNST